MAVVSVMPKMASRADAERWAAQNHAEFSALPCSEGAKYLFKVPKTIAVQDGFQPCQTVQTKNLTIWRSTEKMENVILCRGMQVAYFVVPAIFGGLIGVILFSLFDYAVVGGCKSFHEIEVTYRSNFDNYFNNAK